MLCSHCGKANDNSSTHCAACGNLLNIAENKQQELYKACIGPQNQDYYVRQFERFDNNSGKFALSWNWSAFFITFYWLLYRRMWFNAFIYFLVPFLYILSFILISLLIDLPELVYTAISCIFLLVVTVLPLTCANFLYYKHCNKKINKITEKIANFEIQIKTLSYHNTTRKYGGFFLGCLGTVIFLIFINSSPLGGCGYESTVRYKTSLSIMAASPARAIISEDYAQHGEMPETIPMNEIYFSEYVSSVKWKKHSKNIGLIIITLNAKKELKEAANGSILMRAEGDPVSGAVKFICLPGSVPSKYLYSSCQGK